jgi:hypothetical protein
MVVWDTLAMAPGDGAVEAAEAVVRTDHVGDTSQSPD